MDDLLNLWHRIELVSGSNVKVRAALLSITTDLPALRKITQFLGHKADLGCHVCTFRAQREPGTIGAAGKMSYYTPSTNEHRKNDEIRTQGREFREAETKVAAEKAAQKNGVRYSELSRLPYFDLVRGNCLDPMHTILLGMVQRETNFKLSQQQKGEFLRRIKSLKLPYDIGRLPSNIFDCDSGSLSVITGKIMPLYFQGHACINYSQKRHTNVSSSSHKLLP